MSAVDRAKVGPSVHLADLTGDERRELVKSLGLPAFRADQVARHWFGRLSDQPATWTDLDGPTRDRLVQAMLPPVLTEVSTRTADRGRTRKTLWCLSDGVLVESVLMLYPGRATVCVSTQAGCGMACSFCATGKPGLRRNLSTAEIVEQVLSAARWLAAAETGTQRRVTNVVFMGMGEPLANYSRTVRALRALTSPVPEGFGLSARSMTVSTVGLVPKIRQLAGEGLPVTLAVSLHAPNDRLRSELVPINKRWPIAELLTAADEYRETTGRRVSIEYALIADVNDSPAQARTLAKLLQGRRMHVNLIGLNATPSVRWTAPDRSTQERFVNILAESGIAATIRDSRGQDIDAACGQLAAELGGQGQSTSVVS